MKNILLFFGLAFSLALIFGGYTSGANSVGAIGVALFIITCAALAKDMNRELKDGW